jgi:WD40 repeat protein
LAQSVPRDLETICMKAMAKQASRRFATARDMADDLRRYLQGEPIRARRVGNAERLWRWCRRKPALAGMTAAAAVLLMSIAIGGTLAAVQFRQHAKDAEEELYFTSIGFANRELTASLPNPGRAEQLLDACPPDRRNWEWDYLKGWRIEPRVLQAENSTAFRGIAYSNDGSRLAAACKDGMVRVWNLTTDEVVALPGHTSYVYSVAFSPVDSNRLASSGNDGLIRLWDVNSKQETMPALPGLTVYPVGMANCIAFSPDGQLLAGASHGGAVRIWEAATGNLLHELAGHDLWAGSVAFSRDGRLLATGDWQGKVQIWNPRTGEFLKPLQLPEHLAPVACLAFSPDSPGRHLAAGYFENRVDVWDVWGAPGAENPRRLRGHTSFVTSVAFHPEDDRRLMSAGDDRAVKIWDVPTGREVLQLHGHIDNCSGLAFRPDGRQLASASYDRTIRLWNATPPADHKREELHVFPVAHEVWSVGISPDGKRVAAAIYDGDVQLWDAVTGRKLRTFTDSFSMAVFSMAFSPDGRCIAAAGFDEGTPACVLKVLDAQTGDTLLQHREIPEILATEFSPDGKWLAFGLSDGSIKVLSAKAGNKLVHVGQHDGQIAYGSVRFQPLDGTRLASASLDGTVRVWDLPLVLAAADREGELFAPSPSKYLRWRMPRSDTNIAFWNISYSRDGRRLVTGNKDGQLSLWDAETGAEIATGLNKRSEASSGAFLSAAYSPNGRWIVSASEDCTVRVYDAQSFELVHKFRGHLGPIRCLAVSDEVIVTGGNDRTVRIWNLAQLQSTLELKQSL